MLAEAGSKLINLHAFYKDQKNYELEIVRDLNSSKPSPLFKINKSNGEIYIHEGLTIKGVPEAAWKFKIANKSALEWALDGYKPKKYADEILESQFSKYEVLEHESTVLHNIQKLCYVSIESVEIISQIANYSIFRNKAI